MVIIPIYFCNSKVSEDVFIFNEIFFEWFKIFPERSKFLSSNQNFTLHSDFQIKLKNYPTGYFHFVLKPSRTPFGSRAEGNQSILYACSSYRLFSFSIKQIYILSINACLNHELKSEQIDKFVNNQINKWENIYINISVIC